jgi:hypothetical protein
VAELFEYGALLLFEPAVHGRAPHAPTDNATASATGAALKIRAAAFVFITILLRTGISDGRIPKITRGMTPQI